MLAVCSDRDNTSGPPLPDSSQRADQSQQRRLAAATGACQQNDFTGRDFDRHVKQHLLRQVPFTEPEVHVAR